MSRPGNVPGGAPPARPDRCAPRQTVAGYLFGIARHFVLARWDQNTSRSPRRETATSPRWRPDAPNALDNLTRAETNAAVRAAVQTLPPVYREAVVLCDLQDMDYAAAAASCSVRSVPSDRGCRARARCCGEARNKAGLRPPTSRRG